jgi:hypothetical protein
MELKNTNKSGSGTRTAGMDDRIGSLFQPDTLLGEDYAANFRRKIPLEPERTLLLAVLEDGIRCFQENLFAMNGKRRVLFDEAKEWLFSDDTNWFCSFVSICTLLNLEPNYIRRGLKEWEARERKVLHKKAQGAVPAEPERRLVA